VEYLLQNQRFVYRSIMVDSDGKEKRLRPFGHPTIEKVIYRAAFQAKDGVARLRPASLNPAPFQIIAIASIAKFTFLATSASWTIWTSFMRRSPNIASPFKTPSIKLGWRNWRPLFLRMMRNSLWMTPTPNRSSSFAPSYPTPSATDASQWSASH